MHRTRHPRITQNTVQQIAALALECLFADENVEGENQRHQEGENRADKRGGEADCRVDDIARAVEEQIRRALDNLAPFLFCRRQNEVVVHHQRCNRRIFHQLVVHLAQNARQRRQQHLYAGD